MKEHLAFLRGRGFKLIVVMPPFFEIDHIAENNYRHRRMFAALNMKGVTVVDVTSVWSTARTTDGLHPGPELSYDVAQILAARILEAKAEPFR